MSKELNREIRNKFFKYVIPSVLSMWVFTIYTMVDGMFVAKGVGESALAAVNISMPLINITFGLGILFAVGASIKASIFKGQNNDYEANKVFTNSFVTVFILALIFSLLTFFNLDVLAKLLGSSKETHHYVIDYLSIIILFIPFYMTSYNFEVLIMADGFPKKSRSHNVNWSRYKYIFGLYLCYYLKSWSKGGSLCNWSFSVVCLFDFYWSLSFE